MSGTVPSEPNPAKPPSHSDPASFHDAGEHLSMVLHSLSTAHRYNRWIVDLAAPFLGPHVLEVGAGDGNVASLLVHEHRRVVVAEPYEPFAAKLRDRFGEHGGVDVVDADVDGLAAALDREGLRPEPGFDSALMINVLEHIEDDVAALERLRDAVRPGGHVVVFVPAFPMLYGEFDRRVGHFRRYRLPDLRQRVARAGLDVVDSHYVNCPGWFAWLLVARLGRRVPTTSGNVDAYDRLVVPWLAPLEARFRPPFGQSIFLSARRPAD